MSTPDPSPSRHPIHALLAAFPLALFTTALVTDLAYLNSAQMQWANFSVWLIAGGVAMGVVAALAGLIDLLVTRRHRPRTSLHSILTAALFVVAILNGFVHSRDAWTSVVPAGLILSVITVVLVWVTSWQGYAIDDPSAGHSRRGDA